VYEVLAAFCLVCELDSWLAICCVVDADMGCEFKASIWSIENWFVWDFDETFLDDYTRLPWVEEV